MSDSYNDTTNGDGGEQAYGVKDNLKDLKPAYVSEVRASLSDPPLENTDTYDPPHGNFGPDPSVSQGDWRTQAPSGYNTGGYSNGFSGPNGNPNGFNNPYVAMPSGGSGPGNPNYVPNAPMEKKSQTLGIVSLVFGVLSVICCWTIVLPFIFGLVGIICGIIAAVKKQNMALWLVGIIGSVLGMGVAVYTLITLSPAFSAIIDEIRIKGENITADDIQRILESYGLGN